jgi:hypothetical protein
MTEKNIKGGLRELALSLLVDKVWSQRLIYSYGLRRPPRRGLARHNLGLQRLQRQFLRLGLNLNTLRDESEGISSAVLS